MYRKKIDKEIRQNVIKAYENGFPRKEIAERFGKEKVSQNSNERETVPDTKTERQKRIEDLERRIAELEKKILKFEAGRKGKRANFNTLK